MSELRKVTVNSIYGFVSWYNKSVKNQESILTKLDNISKWHMRQNYNNLLPIASELEMMIKEEVDRIREEHKDSPEEEIQKYYQSLNPILAEIKEIKIESVSGDSIDDAIEKYNKELTNEDMDMLSIFVG